MATTMRQSIGGRVYLRSDNAGQMNGSVTPEALNGPCRPQAITPTPGDEKLTLPKNVKKPICHPMADWISISTGAGIASSRESSEIAFFKDGDWVTDILPEFSEFADAPAGDTLVYSWVPNKLISRFLYLYLQD